MWSVFGLPQVQRLLKDPNELCCPLSHDLMEHPVVAADGITYEHSWVEEQLKRVPGKSPMTGSAIQNTAPWPAFLYLCRYFSGPTGSTSQEAHLS